MTKKSILTAMMIIISVLNLQAQTTKKNIGQVSLIYPVGTNGSTSGNYQYNFSLNLIAGVTGTVAGLEIGGLGNVNQVNMSGVQVGGLFNYTRGKFNGVRVAGLFNRSVKQAAGIQIGGLFNLNKSTFSGLQVAGLLNANKDEVKGLQIAGLVNLSKRVTGFQLALVNISDTADRGISVGLLNIVKQGGFSEFELSVADYQNIGFSFKHGTKNFYNIYNIGYNFLKDNLWSAGMGFGHLLQISNHLDFEPEAIATAYLPENFKNYKRSLTYKLKLGLVYRASDKIGISIAPNIYYADLQNGAAGVAAYQFSSFKAFNSKTGKEHESRLGAGISVGLHLRNK
jgi:hypothetical protein